MHLVLKRCERFGVCGMKTEHYLPVIAVYAIGTIVKVRPIYLFFVRYRRYICFVNNRLQLFIYFVLF